MAIHIMHCIIPYDGYRHKNEKLYRLLTQSQFCTVALKINYFLKIITNLSQLDTVNPLSCLCSIKLYMQQIIAATPPH